MTKYLFIFFISFFLISCRNEKNNKVKKNIAITYSFDFPDTVYVGKKYNGYLYYKGKLDSIVDNFDDLRKVRYCYYLMRKSNDINISMNDLIKLNLDSLGALKNGEIPLFDVEFSKAGVQYLDGIISDFVYIDTDIKNSEGEKMVRNIADEIRATHKIVVIDNPSSPKSSK